MKKSIVFIIYANYFEPGGSFKNFLNIVKFLKPHFISNDYKVSIISFNNNKSQRWRLNQDLEKHSFLSGMDLVFYRRLFPHKISVFQLLEFLINILRLLKSIRKKKAGKVYCFGQTPLYLTAILKPLIKTDLIFDMRGDYLDELKKRGTSWLKIKILTFVDHNATKKSSIVFNVSDAYENTYFPEQHYPKYNYFDDCLFHYSKDLYLKQRSKLNLENRFVFVYNGNVHYYQFLEENIKFFAVFNKIYPEAFLLIISQFDPEYFVNLLDTNDVTNNNYKIVNLEQKQINEYQVASDVALMLREDLPLNHFAFPTKFAEYLASGVPVMTTPHVYSIARMLNENQIGELIEIGSDYQKWSRKIREKYINNTTIKEKCSSFAKEKLMWQTQGLEIFKKIDEL